LIASQFALSFNLFSHFSLTAEFLEVYSNNLAIFKKEKLQL